MFYQVLTLMGRKQQLQQNLSDCQRLLSNCSDMLHIMILTVGRGEKANEVCKYIICREFIMNFSSIANCFHKFRANYFRGKKDINILFFYTKKYCYLYKKI